MSTSDDWKYLGTPAEAKDKLADAARDWRQYRQARMDTAKGHKDHEAKEREARFRLANAALTWLWHEENPE